MNSRLQKWVRVPVAILLCPALVRAAEEVTIADFSSKFEASGSTESGSWFTETRNVYDDYRKLFGEEPGGVLGVSKQIHSQHTKTSAESCFADIAFTRQ